MSNVRSSVSMYNNSKKLGEFGVSLDTPTKPITFNPFPTQPRRATPKEVGLRLGLYSANHR